MIDPAKTRTGGEIVFESFDLGGRTLGECFHPAVGKIPDVSDNLVPGRRALRKKTIADTLHFAAN